MDVSALQETSVFFPSAFNMKSRLPFLREIFLPLVVVFRPAIVSGLFFFSFCIDIETRYPVLFFARRCFQCLPLFRASLPPPSRDFSFTASTFHSSPILTPFPLYHTRISGCSLLVPFVSCGTKVFPPPKSYPFLSPLAWSPPFSDLPFSFTAFFFLSILFFFKRFNPRR